MLRDPPIRAIYVYNSNPVAVAPESGKVRAGFARDDLFCVVHEIFQTDTADFADILLPATTQLEQIDVHTSYGHLYALANNKAIEPLGEALPNTEVFRRLAARMGFTEPCFRDTDEDIARMAFRRDHARARRPRLGHAQVGRLAAPCSARPSTRRSRKADFPTPSGKCELANAMRSARPDFIAPRESVGRRIPTLAQRVIRWRSSRRPRATSSTRPSPTCPSFVNEEGTPKLDIHPRRRASARHRRRRSRAHLQRPRQLHRDRARGRRVRVKAWWSRRRSGGRSFRPTARNANAVTSQALTDLGRAATFYDCLVEVVRE